MEAPLKRKFEEEEGAVDRHVAQKCEEEEVAVTEADCAKYGQSEEEDTDNLTSDQRAPEFARDHGTLARSAGPSLAFPRQSLIGFLSRDLESKCGRSVLFISAVEGNID
eukprot:1176456-Prorocentrum_minimum.AAC.3